MLYILLPLALASAVGLKWRRPAYVIMAVSSAAFVVQGALAFRVEHLAIFLSVAGFVWLISAIANQRDDDRWLPSLMALSLLGMAMALTSTNYLSFLTGWEVMTVPAYVEIGLHRRLSYPAFVFMAFSELSTVLLVGGFSLAYSQTGMVEFVPLHTDLPLDVLAFGFAVKMGILPFMVTEWLPLAHGSAPSRLSAVLSASMTLVALFGLYKMSLLSPQDLPLGWALMSIGGFTVLFGALFAYISDHVKGLLGFSTVENDGALLATLGALEVAPVHSLALMASFVLAAYAVAHSTAKTGLFLLAGKGYGESISMASWRTSSWSKLGVVLLTSSMSGLLPTVGGVATWGLLEVFFAEAALIPGLTGLIPLFTGIAIALGEGFATGAMLRLSSFLQLFRGVKGESYPVVMTSGVIVLVLGLVIYLLSPFRIGAPSLGLPQGSMIAVKLNGSVFGAISPVFVALTLASGFAMTVLVAGPRRSRTVRTWNHGRSHQKYTSYGFSNNVRLMLRQLLERGAAGDVDLFWRGIYMLARTYVGTSKKITRMYMNGSISWYVIYMILAVLLVLVVMSL